METKEQELSFGTKIYGFLGLTYGDISFQSFDRSSTSPTVEVTRVTHVTRVAYLESNDDLFLLGVHIRFTDTHTKSPGQKKI